MGKARRAWMTLAILAAVVCCGAVSALPGPAAAAEPEAREPFQFNTATSMLENLAALKGRSVTVYLTSGQTVTGVVGSAGGNLLHLTRLGQKDFYDALVAIDRIAAIDTRVR